MKTNKQKHHWLIDAALFSGFLLSFWLELTGVALHQWLGVAIGVVAGYHLLTHWTWVKSVTDRFFKQTSARASARRHRSWPARVPAFDGRCECRSSDRGRQCLECAGADGRNNSVDCRAINTKPDGEPVRRDRQYTAAKVQPRDYQHTIAKRRHVHCPMSKWLLVSRPLPALYRQQQQWPLRFWRVRVVT